jgi:hypothetical protein
MEDLEVQVAMVSLFFWIFLQLEMQPKQWLQDIKKRIEGMMNPKI